MKTYNKYNAPLERLFRNLLSRNNSLLLSSVFGLKRAIAGIKSRIKLFYIAENVMRFHDYKDQCRHIVDIVLGFDYLDNESYQRSPIWLEYLFPPFADAKLIGQIVAGFVDKNICADHNKKFACLVAGHDKGNLLQMNKKIQELHTNPGLYKEFVNQHRFVPNAAGYISDLFNDLYAKIKKY